MVTLITWLLHANAPTARELTCLILFLIKSTFRVQNSRSGGGGRGLCPAKGLYGPLRILASRYEPPHDKTNKVAVRPAKTQISLCAQWEAKGPSFLHADSEDSDQTGQMPRLI